MDTMRIWSNIIAYVLQIGLLVGIGAALPVVLRLKVPRARLLYWQLLLAACLALPWVRPWHSETIAVSTVQVAATEVITRVETSAPVRSALPPFPEIALWLLAAGVVVRLGWLAVGMLKLARYRRHGTAMPMPTEWMGGAGHAKLLISDEVSGPVTFGFFRPVVLLPASFPAMSETMRQAILFHELLHVERRDWLFTLGEEIVRAVFWFHPAIWWVLGEIQLAREQTVDQMVIGMTQSRDPYVDTLLAMAGVTPQLDLAPAPLFLRRRHLKQRMMGVIQEVGMSKTRLIFAQVMALTMMAVACWFVTGAVPLAAAPQVVADGAGVSVNMNGSQLMHRSAVNYPSDALVKGVEGTVVVQVRLDAQGEVIDASVLSGPDELRKGVQQSVLTWHFDKSAALTTRLVNIDFVKPVPDAEAPPRAAASLQVVGGTPAPAPSRASQTNPATAQEQQAMVSGFLGGPLQRAQAQLAQLQQQRASASGSQAQMDQQVMQAGQTVQEAKQKLQLAQSLSGTISSPATPAQIGARLSPSPPRRFGSIVVTGLSDSARDQLLAQLPVHTGDLWSAEAVKNAMDAARAFDPHLATGMTLVPDGSAELRFTVPQPASPVATTPGAIRIGANVQQANLISQVMPIYPPLARAARAQGTVRFEATIGKDGTVQDLKVVSGPPLLIQAALDAAKRWVYKPTLLNGAPVDVVTTIDINFTLAQDMPAAPPR